MVEIRFTKIRDVKNPSKGTVGSAGWDFYLPNDHAEVVIEPHKIVLIPTGIHVHFSSDYAFVAHNKSGIGTKKGLDLMACVVDSDYQGEIFVSLCNVTENSVQLNAGEKFVQFLLLPVFHAIMTEVETLSDLYSNVESQRGSGCMGSTN